MSLKELRRKAHDIFLNGCGSHGCRVKSPKGMAPNGPCQCVENVMDLVTEESNRAHDEAQVEEAERHVQLLVAVRKLLSYWKERAITLGDVGMLLTEALEKYEKEPALWLKKPPLGEWNIRTDVWKRDPVTASEDPHAVMERDRICKILQDAGVQMPPAIAYKIRHGKSE